MPNLCEGTLRIRGEAEAVAKTKHEIYGNCHPSIELVKEVQEAGRQVLEQRGNMAFTYAGANSVSEMTTYDLCKEIIRWAKIDVSRGKNAKFVCRSLKTEKELETKRQYQRKHYHERRINNDL